MKIACSVENDATPEKELQSARTKPHKNPFSYFDLIMFERRSDTSLLNVEPDRGIFTSLAIEQLPHHKLWIILICHD